MKTLQKIASLACLLMGLFPAGTYGICTSPQYAEIGQQGTLECDFPAAFSAIIWYDSEDTTNSQVARIERQADGSLRISEDSAEGGTYRVTSNGSLIIPFVSKQHDRNFTVFIVDENSAVSILVIELITVVYPHQDAPLVNSCEGHSPCLLHVVNETLSCTYSHARPAVILSWYHYKSSEGKLKPLVATQHSFSEDGVTFSSILTIHITNMTSNVLSVFTCQAVGPALKDQMETNVLVTNALKERCVSCGKEIPKRSVKLGALLEIPCIDNGIGLPYAYIWQLEQHNQSKTLVFSVKNKVNFRDDVNIAMDVSKDGALIIRRVNFSLTGTYTCFSVADGISSTYSVEIAVQEYNPEGSDKVLKITIGISVALLLVAIPYGVYRCWKRKAINKKARLIEECKAVCDALLDWPFVFESDAALFSKDAIDLLRSISQEAIENKRSKDKADATGAGVGIAGGAAAVVGTFLLPFTFGGSVLLIASGTALSISSAVVGAGNSIEKSFKDKKRLERAHPSLQNYVNIQKSLSVSIVHIDNAFEIIKRCATCKKISHKILEPIVSEMRELLKTISALHEDRQVTPQENIENVMKYSEKLVKTMLVELEKSEHVPFKIFEDQKEAFESVDKCVFDVLQKTVLKLLAYRNVCEREYFTFYTFIRKLYATDLEAMSKSGTKLVSGDETTVLKVGNAASRVAMQAFTATADDVARVGTNVASLARGVAVTGLVLSFVGIAVDVAFLGKALKDIKEDKTEELPKAPTETANMMEEMNEIIMVHQVATSDSFI